MINPAVQRNTEKLNDMVLGHQLAMQFLVPALMNFYTGECPRRTNSIQGSHSVWITWKPDKTLSSQGKLVGGVVFGLIL